MLFNSLEFAVFLPIIFFIYWFGFKHSLKWQNISLLIASYFFYGWWDYRFLFLLMFSTALDYASGIRIHNSKNRQARRFWLWLSIIVNLGFLGVFKYYNFFIESFASLLNTFGMQAHMGTLSVILPVGISFYTFHGLSYVFDIYNKKITPTHNIIDYSLFVSFFPLLVAGPIERATHLLPQIKKNRHFNYHTAIDGLRQILWGLFKKIVIADNCATYVSLAFNNPDSYTGSSLFIGSVLFAFQIYCDFSGYSDIALGTARLFGIELLKNFSYPYFSRDIAEFWRRWHISLSSWFKDYLYIPLGGSAGGTWSKIRNVFIIFLVSGFWHGANWTFIVWGALNAIYFLPLLLFEKNRSHIDIVARGRILPTLRESFNIASTFILTVFAWIFFRASDLNNAFTYISRIFSKSIVSTPEIFPIPILAAIFLFMYIEWLGREQPYAIANFGFTWPRYVRWGFYYCLVLGIFLFAGKEQEFIYFQF